MTTIHAFTNDQVLTDVRHKDLRARPQRHPEHHPDQNRRRQGCRPGAAGNERQAGRLCRARADHQRVAG